MSKKRSVTDRALTSEIVKEVIDEQTGNLAQHHFRTDGCYRDVSGVLRDYARKTAHFAIMGGGIQPNFYRRGWKSHFADDINNTMLQNGLMALIDETKKTMAARFPNRVGGRADTVYSYGKIAAYTGQVAWMILNGLDPKLLEMDEEQANESLMKKAQMMRWAGVPTMIIGIR